MPLARPSAWIRASSCDRSDVGRDRASSPCSSSSRACCPSRSICSASRLRRSCASALGRPASRPGGTVRPACRKARDPRSLAAMRRTCRGSNAAASTAPTPARVDSRVDPIRDREPPAGTGDSRLHALDLRAPVTTDRQARADVSAFLLRGARRSRAGRRRRPSAPDRTFIAGRALRDARRHDVAKRRDGSRNDLNSRKLPLGSSRKNVACSPIAPRKRIFGARR